eukprot:GHVS01023810.1.p1 GENE.GHVS01023810.1~~GHVS01023810.1.p1  ORF type:complete len:300 (-),score=57.10 GHVS01023810.1:500-1399(-)
MSATCETLTQPNHGRCPAQRCGICCMRGHNADSCPRDMGTLHRLTAAAENLTDKQSQRQGPCVSCGSSLHLFCERLPNPFGCGVRRVRSCQRVEEVHSHLHPHWFTRRIVWDEARQQKVKRYMTELGLVQEEETGQEEASEVPQVISDSSSEEWKAEEEASLMERGGRPDRWRERGLRKEERKSRQDEDERNTWGGGRKWEERKRGERQYTSRGRDRDESRGRTRSDMHCYEMVMSYPPPAHGRPMSTAHGSCILRPPPPSFPPVRSPPLRILSSPFFPYPPEPSEPPPPLPPRGPRRL